MKEAKINELLVGKTKTVTVRFPENLLDRIKAAAIKKTPSLARKERGAITEGLLYFVALGLLAWEEQQAGPSGAGTQRGEGEDELKKEGGGYHHSPTAKRGRLLDEDKSKDMIRGNRQGRP